MTSTAHLPKIQTELPLGVLLRPMVTHRDDRGSFTEVFRQQWPTGVEPVQWNFVASEPEVLRGVHVHIRHDDYLMVLDGCAWVGLRDLRQGSPTEGLASVVELRGEKLTAISIPHGVAHGFYFPVPSRHLYAVSEYWDPQDELGCHWQDPELGIPWPMTTAKVSQRDAEAASLKALLAEIEPWQPIE